MSYSEKNKGRQIIYLGDDTLSLKHKELYIVAYEDMEIMMLKSNELIPLPHPYLNSTSVVLVQSKDCMFIENYKEKLIKERFDQNK